MEKWNMYYKFPSNQNIFSSKKLFFTFIWGFGNITTSSDICLTLETWHFPSRLMFVILVALFHDILTCHIRKSTGVTNINRCYFPFKWASSAMFRQSTTLHDKKTLLISSPAKMFDFTQLLLQLLHHPAMSWSGQLLCLMNCPVVWQCLWQLIWLLSA